MIPGGRSDGFRQKSLAQKAEEMRAQKAAYESARSKLDVTLKLGRSFDTTAFTFAEKEEAITRAAHRPAWDEAEKLATALEEEARTLLRSKLQERLDGIPKRVQLLAQIGVEGTADQSARVENLTKMLAEGHLEEAINEVGLLDAEVGKKEETALVTLADQVDSVLKWALPNGGEEKAREALAPCLEFVKKRDLEGASRCFEENLKAAAPQIGEKLNSLANDLSQVLAVAKLLGVSTEEGERLLEQTKKAPTLAADKMGATIAAYRPTLEEKGRAALRARIELQREVLAKAVAAGESAGEIPHEIEGLLTNVGRLPLIEAHPLLAKAQSLIETPVLNYVFDHLEEARAYVDEGRELGRESPEALEKIRQVRDAIRDKDYVRVTTLAAAALDIARALVEDVEIARTELEEYRALLARLSSGGLDAQHFQTYVQRAEQALAQRNYTAVREVLREGVRAVGKESSQYLAEQLDRTERTLTLLAERHWAYPDTLNARIEEANLLLSSARVTEAADVISDIMLQVKETVNVPMLARLGELESSVELIGDQDARSSASSMIVQLRSPQGGDPLAWLEKLRAIEREVNVVLASEVGRVVADLDDGLARLQKMGIPTDDQSREIVRIREIFDVGDYRRAAKSGSELLASMNQLAVTKAEESISEAKLALVEVSKSVPEPTTVRESLETARTALQANNFLEAVENAQRAIEQARKIQASSQSIIDRISMIVNQMTSLRKKGASPEDIRVITGKIADVRTAYQSLAFEAAESTIGEIMDRVATLSTKMEIRSLSETVKGMLDGAGTLGLPESDWVARVDACVQESESGDPKAPMANLNSLTEEILARFRPVLDQQVQVLDGELRAAREQGLETREPDGLLADVKTRVSDRYPSGVIRSINQIRMQFFQSKAFQETATRALVEAREMVNQADLMRLDVKALAARTAETEEKQRSGDFGGVLEAAQAIKEEAGTLVRAHLNQVLTNLQGMISRAKREGALTMVAENYLAKARGLVGSSSPMEVLQLVTQAENEIEKVELQYSIAQNSLQTLSGKVQEAERGGLIVPEVTSELEAARHAFESGEYSQLLEIVLRANDQLQTASSQSARLKETRSRLEPLLSAVAHLQVDHAELDAASRAAEELAAKGKYSEADGGLRAASEKARVLFDHDLNARIEGIRVVIEFFADGSTEGSPLSKSLSEVRALRAKEDWDGTVKGVVDLQSEATTRFQSELSKERDRLKAVSGLLPKDQIASFDQKMDVATSLTAKRSFLEATVLCKEIRAFVNSLLTTFIESELVTLDRGARLAEKLGGDGSPIAEGVTETKTMLRQDTPDAALQRVLETRSQLDGILTAKLTPKLQEAGRNLNLARDVFNVATQGLPERLKAIEEQQQKGDLLGAGQELLLLGQDLTRRKGWQKELVDLHFLIDTLIAQAEEARKSTPHPAELLQKSIEFKVQGDYEQAIQTAGSAVKELKESLGAEKKEGTA